MLRFQNDDHQETNNGIVFSNSIFTSSLVSEKQMNSSWTHSNILCAFQKHFELYTWNESHQEAHMFESDTHGRTSKGYAWQDTQRFSGPCLKGSKWIGLSIMRKPHQKQNRALAYSIDGRSDIIVGYWQLDVFLSIKADIIADLCFIYSWHNSWAKVCTKHSSYNVRTMFVQLPEKFVQCSYNLPLKFVRHCTNFLAIVRTSYELCTNIVPWDSEISEFTPEPALRKSKKRSSLYVLRW